MFKKVISASAAIAAGALGYKIAEKTIHEKAAPLVGAVVTAATYNVVSQTLKDEQKEEAVTEDIPWNFMDIYEDQPTPNEVETEQAQEEHHEDVTDSDVYDPEHEESNPIEDYSNGDGQEEIMDPYPDENMNAPYEESDEEEVEEVEGHGGEIPEPTGENREEFVNKFIEAAERGEDAVQQFIKTLDTEDEPIADSLPAFQNDEPQEDAKG